ncbi:hypothetical protein ACEPAF_8706 [Sanghuangporus sanghuang]
MPYDYDSDYYASAFGNSYAYGSSEGEYSTADTTNFNYSASRVPIGEYAGAYGGTAEDSYNYDASSAGPSTAGGLADGMANNAGPGVSTFTGAPLLHPPSYGTGVPAFMTTNLITDRRIQILTLVDTLARLRTLLPHRPHRVIRRLLTGRMIICPSNLDHSQWPRDLSSTRPHGFDASTSTSAYYLSAGLPATASTMPSSAPAPEISHGPTGPAHADANSSNSMPLGINSFAVSANSLSTLPLPGTSNKPPQVQRPVSEVNPDVHRCTLLGEPNTGAAREPTAVNTAPSGLSVTPSDIPTTTTSASQGKRRPCRTRDPRETLRS